MYISAFVVGVLLSLVFIGPVFFLLIETSISKGWKYAVALDLGVIVCDLLFIFLIYFSLRDVTSIIDDHPQIQNYAYRIGGLVLVIYGFVMFFKKEKIKHIKQRKTTQEDHNYFKAFANGFLLNLLNVGVIFFWFGVVSSLAIQFDNTEDFLTYISIVFATFFGIDLLKIFLARKLAVIVDDRFVYKLRRVMGIILVLFGILLLSKSYGAFKAFDEKVEQRITKPKMSQE